MGSVGSPFWEFSIQYYPGIATECLQLQDEVGIDVNVLLFLLWAATQRRHLNRDDIEQLDAIIRDWRESVVFPMRSVRRMVKTLANTWNNVEVEVLRGKIKMVELEAERLQQETMYAEFPLIREQTSDDLRALAVSNIHSYGAFLGVQFEAKAVSALVEALRS